MSEQMKIAKQIEKHLGDFWIRRIANLMSRHPRYDHLAPTFDVLVAWGERVHLHVVNEIERIGPSKTRQQMSRIINEMALVG